MKSRRTVVLVGWALAVFAGSGVLQGQTISIDFRNGAWEHETSPGVFQTFTGWQKPAGSTRGYTSGRTTFSGGTVLNVSTRFFGTAQPGPNNFTVDAVNTPGFSFQNLGTGDTNPNVDGNGRTILQNYQRIDFAFSRKVSMGILRLSDIDTSGTGGPTGQAWRDTVGLELWNGMVPAVPGSGIDPTITLGPGSFLRTGITAGGLPFAFADTIGNTATSNPAPPNDPSTASFSYNQDFVDGFSVYLWNRGMGTGSQHAVVLQATGSEFNVIPEPSAMVMVVGALVMGCGRRRR